MHRRHLWRTKPCRQSEIGFYMLLLRFAEDRGLRGREVLPGGEAATRFGRQEVNSGVGPLGHDKWMWPQIISVCVGPMTMAQAHMPPPIFLVVTTSSRAHAHTTNAAVFNVREQMKEKSKGRRYAHISSKRHTHNKLKHRQWFAVKENLIHACRRGGG